MRLKGSFTIEASMIFPIVLLALVAFLFIGIYVHEVTSLQAIANKLSSETSELTYKYSEEELIKKVIEEVIEEVNKLTIRDLMLQQGEVTVDCKISKQLLSSQIELTITKTFMTPIKRLNQFMKDTSISKIQMQVHSTCKFNEPTRFIRAIDFMDDVTSEVTVTNDLKENYRDMMNQIKEIIDKWV